MFGMFNSLKRLMSVTQLDTSANLPLAISAVSLWRFVAIAIGTPLKKVTDLNVSISCFNSETILEITSFASFLKL